VAGRRVQPAADDGGQANDDRVADLPARNPRGTNSVIPRHRQREVIREIAAGELTHAAIAARWGVTRQAITALAGHHAREIDEIRANLDDEFAGLWAASKQNRIAAYQDEIERLDTNRNANHHEWSKARQAALRAVADELGQIPARMTLTMTGTVTHRLVGVDVDEAFPPMPEEAAESAENSS